MQQATLAHQQINFRKERNFSEKINATFTFLSQNIKPIGKNILFLAGPFALLAGICYSVYQAYAFDAAFSGPSAMLEGAPDPFMLGLGVIGMMFFGFIAFTLVVAILMKHIRLYMEEGHTIIRTEYLLKTIWKDFFSVLGTSIFIAVLFACCVAAMAVPAFSIGAISGGSVFFNIILILCMFGLMLFSPALLLLYPIRSIEKVGVFKALDRMVRLISGKWLSTTGLVIVVQIIQSVIAIVFAVPMYILLFVRVMHVADEGAGAQTGNTLIDILFSFTTGISMLGSFSLYGLVMLAITFQYFNLVERKEATGLLERIGDFGGQRPETDDYEEQY